MNQNPSVIKYFENFDCLRFLLASYVLLFHYYGIVYNQQEDITIFYTLSNFITRNGIAAVSCFFVLSGFLITYLTQVEQRGNKFNIFYFWLKRALRIWPLYFIILTIGFMVQGSLNGLFYYIPFLANVEVIYRNEFQNGILFPLWSVAIEEQFYFFFPLLIFFFKLKKTKSYLIFFSILIIISTIYQFNVASNITKIRYSTLSCITDLSIGGLFATLSLNSERFLNRFRNLKLYLIVVIYFLGIIYLYGRVYFYNYPVVIFTQHLILSLFFAFILMEQTFSENSFFKLKRFKVFSSWGKYTYGIYMYHAFILGGVMMLMEAFSVTNDLMVLVVTPAVILLLTILLSKLSFNYLELPINRLRGRFKDHRVFKNPEIVYERPEKQFSGNEI